MAIQDIEKQLKEIAESFAGIQEKVATEGITTKEGEVLLEPTVQPKPTFDVDTPTDEVDISGLGDIQTLRNQVRGIEDRFTREAEAQVALEASIEPSPRALELQRELLTERQAGRAGEEAIRGQPIVQPLIGKQAEKLREQVKLREMPLIEELKLEALKQQTVFEKAKAKLGFETAGIERVLDLEKEFRQMDRTQRQDARGLLEGIIGQLEGLAFEDLDPDSQAKLEAIIAQTGISPELIKAGMANAKRIAQEKEEAYQKEADWLKVQPGDVITRTDNEIRAEIRGLREVLGRDVDFTSDKDYQFVLDAIELDETLRNKVRARFLVDEMFGKTNLSFSQWQAKATGTTPTTKEVAKPQLTGDLIERARGGESVINPETGKIITKEDIERWGKRKGAEPVADTFFNTLYGGGELTVSLTPEGKLK